MLNAASAKNESPFTATQRQELEHQALIFKYIVAGVPVPHELLYSIKRSLESSVGTSGLFPHHHQPVGWGCIQVGFGRKADPEPGRCRRTDGKKWRCSKEAYPDSKYCEKHMHRARNRSRKPVEHAAAAATATNASPSINIDPNSTNSPSSSTCILSPYSHQNPGHKTNLNPFFYPHTSSSRSPGCAVTPRNCTTSNLFPDSGSPFHADNDYRYNHGKASGSVRGLQHPYQELTMSSYKDYSELGFESCSGTTEHQQQQQQEQQQQSCFVLGTDFKSSEAATRPFKLEKEAEIQKSLHHIFDN